MPICPRRLKDRPGGHGPSDARSTRAGDAVAVADLAMQRIVAPDYAGSVSAPLRSAQNRGPLDLVRPVSHLQLSYCTKELRQKNCYMI